MKNVAYLRVSTNDGRQSTDRQFDNDLSQFDEVYTDHMSGSKEHRPELEKCLASLEKGDVLHVNEISRLSRNLDHLRKFVNKLLEKGVSVKFKKEGIEFCADEKEFMKMAVSKMMLSMLGAVAEFERGMISSRIKDALAVKKAQGIKLGAAAPAYKRNPNNATERNRKEAVERTKGINEKIQLIMATIGGKATNKYIGAALTAHGVLLPSGVLGVWKDSQVARIRKRFSESEGVLA